MSCEIRPAILADNADTESQTSCMAAVATSEAWVLAATDAAFVASANSSVAAAVGVEIDINVCVGVGLGVGLGVGGFPRAIWMLANENLFG